MRWGNTNKFREVGVFIHKILEMGDEGAYRPTHKVMNINRGQTNLGWIFNQN
jgi:hypothetical protein